MYYNAYKLYKNYNAFHSEIPYRMTWEKKKYLSNNYIAKKLKKNLLKAKYNNKDIPIHIFTFYIQFKLYINPKIC